MKKRLNITIREDLVKKMKKYAENQDSSISSIVEDYFEDLLEKKPEFPKQETLLDFVKTLPKSKVIYPKDFDFKKEYYLSKAKKYDDKNSI
jgi:hypothetical protein